MADRYIQIKIGMPEMPAEEMTELFKCLNNDTHIVEVEPTESNVKTPSQRLRSVLFVLWNQSFKSEYEEFDAFYKIKMKQIIDNLKNQLTP